MTPKDLTAILSDLRAGDRRAGDILLQTLYDELHRMAESRLKREPAGHTLQATALVHEAYLRLVDQTRVDWQGRTHFHAVAAQAMRRALVDHARRRNREKRGGKWRKVALDDAFALAEDHHLDLLALHEAMEKMRRIDERQAAVAEFKLFAGLSAEEIARVLDVSARTVEREWKVGQAWLRRELSEGD